MPVESVQTVENYIRGIARNRKCRFEENFLDYDNLRSGYVTANQFLRILRNLLGVPLEDSHKKLIFDKYGVDENQYINWRKFVRIIEGKYDENDFSVPPELKVLGTIESSNIDPKFQHHLTDNIKCRVIRSLLSRINQFITYHGYIIRQCYKQYDIHNTGEVTESQFFRGFPGPKDVSDDEIMSLVQHYKSLTNPGFVNYIAFERDLEMINFEEKVLKDKISNVTLYLEKDPLKQIIMPQRGALSKQLCVLSQEDEDRVSKLIEEIKNQVREKRILTFPYFRDYDIGSCFSRSITDTQFERVLHFLGLNLSKEDCRRLCKKFTNSINGCIDYEAFCQRVDEWLTAAAAVNFQADNTDVIHEVSNNNQLECIPEIGNTRCGKNAGRRNWYSTVVPVIKSAGDQWPVDVLIDRIRHLILVNRIPLKPWFHDFDQLRSGYVTRSQFERCLAAAGLTRLGVHDLTPTQANMLADNYMSSTNPHMVNWIKFVYDIDTVFTLPGLEKQPLTRVLPQELFIQPKRGTANWLTATEEMRQNYENAMTALRQKVNERQLVLTPDFVAFDSLHRGVVTVNNFRQLISMCGFCLSPEEIDAIISRYTNDDGFNYLDFLTHLCSSKSEENKYMYPKRLETLQRTNVSSKEIMETESVVKDAEGIMDMLKAEVYQRSLRLSDWFRDHDKLNHGCLPRITFRRCLGVLNLKINETMLNVLEDRYKGSLPDTIDWRAFTNDVETIFQTPNLEKDPLVEPNAYKPVSSVAKNHLTASIAKSVDEAITKIAAKVRQRRILLPAMFSDFDETHRLTVNQNQFRRVLTTLGLGELLTEKEWTAIFCKYCHRIGLTNNVNYQAFTDDVYTTAGMDPSIP
ncbi:EF Hand type [Schistosoma japonicum]|nr:EF Hand type [Schistosoma japonicum]